MHTPHSHQQNFTENYKHVFLENGVGSIFCVVLQHAIQVIRSLTEQVTGSSSQEQLTGCKTPVIPGSTVWNKQNGGCVLYTMCYMLFCLTMTPGIHMYRALMKATSQ